MRVRRRSEVWEVAAPAKLNLYLEVLGKRPDGFHDLETLMVPIGISDRLWLSLSDKSDDSRDVTLEYHPATCRQLQAAAPLGDDNLVLRAARALAQVAGLQPAGQFTLHKQIPVGAGMGGGSSDAAAALLLANEAWGLSYSRSRLMTIAADLGSDVPFFIDGEPAICRGRGELVEPLDGLPRLHVVAAMPPASFMTAEVFGRLVRQSGSFASHEESSTRLSVLTDLLRRGAIARCSDWMRNRLQQAAAEASDWVGRLEGAFTRAGCDVHLMTGSGAGYFGLARSSRHARMLAAQLRSWKLGKVWATATGR
ncbi:MAG: 4-(cytidine 5'-diphospho)-2-C-methyl-D-erythritol kinase [Planctomycetales bacterium]|nr:4-(cytidine 5'-diphospho)-2-C-methyl-D-erythritol kinase [Planctomycetales bacterium]